MSRGTALLVSLLQSFRSISSIKTGNTLGTTVEIVRPPPEDMADGDTKTATFAMSWFWFPEAQFGCANGVVRTMVGYTGGTKAFPTYTNLWVLQCSVCVNFNIHIMFFLCYKIYILTLVESWLRNWVISRHRLYVCYSNTLIDHNLSEKFNIHCLSLTFFKLTLRG